MNLPRKCLCVVLAALLSFGPPTRPAALLGAPATAPRPAVASPEMSLAVNETVPKVEPPRPALTFSARPTTTEIFQARLFEEPMVPVGGTPTEADNAALAAALLGYAKRSGPDDFSSLTGYLERHPKSPWRAALLTNLGLEYYRTAHYSLALKAWTEAWQLAKEATEPGARAIADRAVGELACMYARVGRMADLEALLKSVEGRVFNGPATEKIVTAREGLASMHTDPGASFRCGPMALSRIQASLDPKNLGGEAIRQSASTKDGFSLPQVAELSQKLGLNYQMAFRKKGAPIVTPSVIHWGVGHYAAIIRQEPDGRYLVQDPTFRNDVWVTAATLDAEGSGYFVIPPGALADAWRPVGEKEGSAIWGKGHVGGGDPGGGPGPTPPPPCPGGGGGSGMAVPTVGLLFISLTLEDTPITYKPPVGPSMDFTIHYNQRESGQPANFAYSNLGPKWTLDWISYIQDDPTNPIANVTYYRRGGFIRYFTGFDTTTQTYTLQPLDQTKLVRTSPTSYELRENNGAKAIFSQSDGSAGTSRKVFLKQYIDPAGDALTFTYDANLRIVAITDALGQVSTFTYGLPGDIYKITKITDPFGRFATLDYDGSGRLMKITDVLGLTSQFAYAGASDFIDALTTPYGTTAFTKTENGTTRSLEILYPDGNRERAEFNQDTNATPTSEPAALVPTGMQTFNQSLNYRNTYYWSKIACAAAYGDYTKAKIYHWLHTTDLNSATSVLESVKEPLENRVWYDYTGQPNPYVVGTSSQPAHIGRVLDDGSTQIYTKEYNDFGKLTKEVDPLGRTFSYTYDASGVDLLEARMTRNGASELLAKTTYNNQHLPLKVQDAARQVTTITYNARGQVITRTNSKGETTTYGYDAKGNRIAIDGPLPGAADRETFTYDAIGRTHSRTTGSGYGLIFDYDALDHLTRITFPDGSFESFNYTRLDLTSIVDRAGQATNREFNSVRQLVKETDPLGRTTLFDWCKCGEMKNLTDPMGRTTIWHHDVQARRTSKEYPDGSKVQYYYEGTTSRLQRQVDEKGQETRFAYNRDNAVSGVSYANAAVATPSVSFTYDPDYPRLVSMTDGTGSTLYRYHPITDPPALGAGLLASVDGPLPNDTITYAYDALGRRVSTAVGGSASTVTFDAGGRRIAEAGPLGTMAYGYDAGTLRLASKTFPNGLTTAYQYGTLQQDEAVQRITHLVGTTPISEFLYTRDVPKARITAWSQQAGAQPAVVHGFTYDAANQLTADALTTGGAATGSYAYSYDAVGNRLSEEIDGNAATFTYNALNELAAQEPDARPAATYHWDAANRLVEITTGAQATQFTYDGVGRRVSIRQLVNGAETSLRRFLWCDQHICEERDAAGAVTKRFYANGVKVETGPSAGNYFYTRDHLGSVRELVDSSGAVRARYRYDPFGRATRVAGDLQTDFGFAGMFWSPEASLNLTYFRAYDPGVARWLSRDPLPDAELSEGPNLYAYVQNNPVHLTDPFGLEKSKGCCKPEKDKLMGAEKDLADFLDRECLGVGPIPVCVSANDADLENFENAVHAAQIALDVCLAKGCGKKPNKCPGK